MGIYDEDGDEIVCGMGNVEAAVEAVERLGTIERVSEADTATAPGLLVVPKGREVVDLRKFQDERLDRPRRLEGIATHTTLDSFIEHTNRFKGPESVIYADDSPKRPVLTAIFDYHEGHAAPQFGKHRSKYNFPVSDEWEAWSGLASRGYISQGDFAQWLEDHIADVLLPSDAHPQTHAKAKAAGIELGGPSTLMGLARSLSVHVASEFTQATTLATGEGQLTFKESHTAMQDHKVVKVPSGFALSIPVFRGSLREDVIARLRYRPAGGGKIGFAVLLHGVDAIFRHEFDASAARAAEKTALPVFYGSPE